MAREKILTPEQQQRKDVLRFRLFVVLIILILLMIGYLVYEMVSVFATGNNTTVVSAIEILNKLL